VAQCNVQVTWLLLNYFGTFLLLLLLSLLGDRGSSLEEERKVKDGIGGQRGGRKGITDDAVAQRKGERQLSTD